MTKPVFVGSAQWVAATPGNRTVGLFRQTSPQGEWKTVNTGLPENVEIRCIERHPTDADTLWVGTQEGPFRSTDGGDSWTRVEFPVREVTWSIQIHPSDPQVVYVGTVDLGLYRSEDAGQSWQQLSIAEPDGMCKMGFPTRMIRLAMDPLNPDEVYAALEVGGLVRSLDAGRSWSSCNRELLELAALEQYKSKIGSDTDSEGMMDSHSLAISPSKPGTLFLANRMGLFQSPDKGETWQDMDVGRFSPLTYARDVIVSSHNPDRLYAALSIAAVSDEGSLYQSDDLGESWTRFDHDVSIDSTLMIVDSSRNDPNRVYCAARRGQVFGTEDGGKSWTQSHLPRGVEGVYAIACI